MSTLVQLEARVSARLIDASNLTFTLATIDEALRTALADYSAAFPFTNLGTVTLAAAGREIPLSSIAGLINVLDAWWPYVTSPEAWPPNQVATFRVWWDNSVPTLLLSSKSGAQPQIGDKVRVWYTKQHTIQNLDAAAATTFIPLHESGIVSGAAAYAVYSEMRHQIGNIHVDPQQVASLNQWGTERMGEFHDWLAQVATTRPQSGAPDRGGTNA